MGKALKWGCLGFLGFTLLVAAIGGFIVDKTTSPEQRAAEQRQFAEFQDVQRAKRAVSAVMREPESARFGRVARMPNGYVCGYASGRNGFGGMTGMRAFMFRSADGGLMMEEQGRRRFFKVWNTMCADQPGKANSKSGKPRKRLDRKTEAPTPAIQYDENGAETVTAGAPERYKPARQP